VIVPGCCCGGLKALLIVILFLFCLLVVVNHRSVNNVMKIFALIDLDVYAICWTHEETIDKLHFGEV
jgi:hypothetical protein